MAKKNEPEVANRNSGVSYVIKKELNLLKTRRINHIQGRILTAWLTRGTIPLERNPLGRIELK